VSDVEEVQLMVSSDAAKSGSLKRGHKRTGSTGSAKSGFHFSCQVHLATLCNVCVACLNRSYHVALLSIG